MGDNWGFVLSAYGIAAVVLIAYWRFLVRRERQLTAIVPSRRQGSERLEQGSGASAVRQGSDASREGSGGSEPPAPAPGHPRSNPASRTPLP